MTRRPQKAEPGRTYPAWRDGRKITDRGPKLHAATNIESGHSTRSGFYALCGRPVRYKVEDVFDPDDDQSCLECAASHVSANAA